MNPDEIVNQQDGILYMDPSWNKSATPKPGYIAVKVRTVSYANGRVVRTALNDDGSVLGDIDTTYDTAQKKVFDDSAPPGGSLTQPKNGHTWGWNSKTQTYDIDQGPITNTDPGAAAADANAVELQRQRERNNALPKEQDPAYETDAERRARGRQTALDQEGATARATAAADKAKADAAATEQRNRPTISYKKVGQKTYKVLTYPDGREEVSKSALPPDVSDDQITTVNGQPAHVVRDANGKATGIEVLPVTGQGTDPTFTGTPPAYVPKAISDDLTAYSKQLADAVASGSITPARATALMDARHKSAQAAVDNELDAAKTAYQGGINQRTQDVSLANQRLSTSGTNFNTVSDMAGKINSTLPPGSDAGGKAFLAGLGLAQSYAKGYGGLNDIPQAPLPAAIQRAMGITIQSPDGTVVTVPHPSGGGEPAAAPTGPQPPSPGMDPAQLLSSMRAPSTGFAALDATAPGGAPPPGGGPPMTFDSMEQTFRNLGMDEDAIQQSRRNFMGAAA